MLTVGATSLPSKFDRISGKFIPYDRKFRQNWTLLRRLEIAAQDLEYALKEDFWPSLKTGVQDYWTARNKEQDSERHQRALKYVKGELSASEVDGYPVMRGPDRKIYLGEGFTFPNKLMCLVAKNGEVHDFKDCLFELVRQIVDSNKDPATEITLQSRSNRTQNTVRVPKINEKNFIVLNDKPTNGTGSPAMSLIHFMILARKERIPTLNFLEPRHIEFLKQVLKDGTEYARKSFKHYISFELGKAIKFIQTNLPATLEELKEKFKFNFDLTQVCPKFFESFFKVLHKIPHELLNNNGIFAPDEIGKFLENSQEIEWSEIQEVLKKKDIIQFYLHLDPSVYSLHIQVISKLFASTSYDGSIDEMVSIQDIIDALEYEKLREKTINLLEETKKYSSEIRKSQRAEIRNLIHEMRMTYYNILAKMNPYSQSE